MKKTTLFILFALAILFSSCGNQRQLAINMQRAARLSQQMGFTVHPKENLFLYEEVAPWLGTPYRNGGTTRQGVDCSGFVMSVYENLYGHTTNRTVEAIYEKDIKNVRKRKLQAGDLLFFNFTTRKNTLSHIGIFLKKGYFIHASTSKGVTISHLSDSYYRKGWKKSGKIEVK